MLAALLSVGSCGSEAAPDTDRDAEVYAAVIRALAAEAPPDVAADEVAERVIFVGPLDQESPISLEVQAATVEQFENAETIRFIDHRDEAIDSELPEAPVRDDGILILGGTVPGGSAPSIDAELYVNRADVTQYTAMAQRQNGEWTVVSLEPAQ